MELLVFVVDDDVDYSELLAFHLSSTPGVRVMTFGSGEAVLNQLEKEPDLVLLDVMMPGIDGLETLRRIKARYPRLPVVMVSVQSTLEVALSAVKLGAADYLLKGQDDFVKLGLIVRQIVERKQLRHEIAKLQDQVTFPRGFEQLIGESPAMRDVYRQIERALRGELIVTILGESGTGKELVAQAIHQNSGRKSGPFVVVNCAAIPRDLMESEIFGHEKGSFTGAVGRRIGRFEEAHRGTIFLDEIGELDQDLQAKLLRILQDGKLQRIGGSESRRVDTRVVAATNRDITAMVASGEFREDLYYRLFQFPIFLPPLRAREQDVLLLADHFLADYIKRNPQVRSKTMSSEVRRSLMHYAWPGNVRELKNVIERAVLMSDASVIEEANLVFGARATALSPDANGHATEFANGEPEAAETDSTNPRVCLAEAIRPEDLPSLDELKEMALLHAYEVCGGNIEKTARCLGVTRSTVYRLMKKFGVDEGRTASASL